MSSVPWNKGLKLSQEYRDKLSKSHKGQKAWNKGLKMSDEFRKKVSESKIGKSSVRKGVKLSDEMRYKYSICQTGKKHSDETKNKISQSMKGHFGYNKGIKFSDETRKKMSKSQKKKWFSKSIEQKEKEIKELIDRPKKFQSDTSIELKVERDLIFYRVRYIKQKFISSDTRNFVLDFYIPSLKLVIECNGDYWHNLPERKQRDKELKEYVESTGRKIVFIWEHEIKDEWFDIMDYIK